MIFIIMILSWWDRAIRKDDDQRDGDEDNLFKVFLCTRMKVIMIFIVIMIMTIVNMIMVKKMVLTNTWGRGRGKVVIVGGDG